MTVWCVNLDKYDKDAALAYGDLRHINLKYVYGDEIDNQCMPTSVENALNTAALEFKADRDYLLIGGDHLQLVAFAAMLGRLGGKGQGLFGTKFRVLRWDKKAQGYLVCWV